MLVEQNIKLSSFTTFKIGGVADYFCCVKDEKELKEAVFFAKQKKLPVFFLGGGSNLLISDGGFRGLVIRIEILGIEFKLLENGQAEVIVGAGENWDNFVSATTNKKLFGLENLSGIPGTVGGAVIQNAGAYGKETGNFVNYVEVFDMEKVETKIIPKLNCKFSYRDSFFKTKEGRKLIVLRASFLFSQGGKLNISYKDLKKYIDDNKLKENSLTPSVVRKIILEIRGKKFPDLVKIGTAGSFFKNPVVSKKKYHKLAEKYRDLPFYEVGESFVKIPLAWILDNVCNMKGFKSGQVGLYEKQPLVLVNFGGATSAEVNALAIQVSKIVKEKTGIEIEREVESV